MSWVAPHAASRHGNIASYSLAYQALSGEGAARRVVTGIGINVSSYVLEDLERWTEYVVWLKTHSDKGLGPESPAAHTRTQEDGMLSKATLELPLARS